ncbi:HlyU family transcriptional regulator [Photobacterium sp. WH77]|uniref:Transcriptional regulator n=1 Tax=Photobacterium arenosum TaxID=2774143 RepID=A0ABR9BF97_9GAMM|nr:MULTISPECIES: HlyU family transcriptional regulator [Photobacterium]MBD8511228.1 transcriptional regulator [Photobacterium arenosum]MCG2837909.1 HlyU family transcriptional regulator [Photobacterium sp. WH77]MCG2845527.1 HlyU family transcriptional regulator [Photobacterium sp. WH80]MDO6581891.1 HlyU family transcriptional regulator [Photobacterium sp. 2_MG-2023]
MGFWSKLFGRETADSKTLEVTPEEYKGYLIYPEPISEGGQFRIAGRICKECEGELKTHTFIRSDLLASKADATTFMVNKAKMFIDQTGEAMFR